MIALGAGLVIACTILLLVNIAYVAIKTMGDAQARRWGWVVAGGAALIGALGLLLLVALTVFGLGAIA